MTHANDITPHFYFLTQDTMGTKFYQDYIQQNGKKFPVRYSLNLPAKQVVVYERYTYNNDHHQFYELEELQVVNNSDAMTDYFEKGRVYLQEGDRYYTEALDAALKKQERSNKRRGNQRLQRALLIESTSNKILVKGRYYEVVTQEPHPIFQDMTRYTLKQLGGRAKKLYSYSESSDKKRYCPLRVVGAIA